MKWVLSIFLIFPTFAAIECHQVDELKTKLNIYSSNYLNAENTKGSDGSFYKKRIVQSCHNGKCHVIKLNRFKQVYNPTHPDADANGHVKYPFIDKTREYALINKSVRELKVLARKKACNTKLLVNRKDRSVFKVKYIDDPVSDKFKFQDDKVMSWTVESPVGNNTIVFHN